MKIDHVMKYYNLNNNTRHPGNLYYKSGYQMDMLPEKIEIYTYCLTVIVWFSTLP